MPVSFLLSANEVRLLLVSFVLFLLFKNQVLAPSCRHYQMQFLKSYWFTSVVILEMDERILVSVSV